MRVKELRVGNRILTLDHGVPVTTVVLGFLEKKTLSKGIYLRISLKNGLTLSISPTHVMFVLTENNFIKDVFAKDIFVGDVVYALNNRKGELVEVVNITKIQMTGAYVPLTDTGTLIVDGVLVSCYTNTYHWLAHSILAPFRWLPNLLFGNAVDDKSKWTRTLTTALKKLGRVFNLVTTFESMANEDKWKYMEKDNELACGGLQDWYSH